MESLHLFEDEDLAMFTQKVFERTDNVRYFYSPRLAIKVSNDIDRNNQQVLKDGIFEIAFEILQSGAIIFDNSQINRLRKIFNLLIRDGRRLLGIAFHLTLQGMSNTLFNRRV